jgi:chemotaxis protein methyltransferase CheR
MAGAMEPDGWLMLGAGETVIGQTRRFEADPEARGLYRPVGTADERRSGDDRRTVAR